MDAVVLVGIGVAVAAFVWFFIMRDNDEKTDVTTVTTPKPEPVNRAPGGRRSEAPIPAEAKQAAKAKPAVKTLPGKAALESLTKAKLEELGRDMGVELDKRKTKANMITDLRAGVRK